MSLRLAKSSDASSIAAISIEVWVGTYLRYGVSRAFADYVLSEFTSANIGKQLRDPNEFILVSDNSDGIDGFIRVSSKRASSVDGLSGMEISTFYVQPRHHGKGIGRSLLAAALKYCRSKQESSVWLTTNAENAPAIAFYVSQGFKQIGETHFWIEGEGYLNNVYAFDLS